MASKSKAGTGLGISAKEFERVVAEQPHARYVLKLYVSGMTPRSLRAIGNLQKLCAKFLPGRHELEIIDIYQQPALTKEAQIVAVPTLVKELPAPLRRVIGDLSDRGRILLLLGIKPGDSTEQSVA
ncbi:MAG TPA: circadian clock KaiB family protein [Steroidobacteraceae bacterium]|nr:circadian clock KaiB family protein [Steroidobacteraceae bacterium]